MAKKIDINLFIDKIQGISLNQTEELHRRVGEVLKKKQEAVVVDAENKVAQLRMQYGIPKEEKKEQTPAY